MRSWIVAFICTVTCAVSLGLFASPAGALETPSVGVTDAAAGVVTGGTFTFTATVSGSSGIPTGTVTWTVTDPLGHGVSCPDSTLDGTGVGTCTVPAPSPAPMRPRPTTSATPRTALARARIALPPWA